MRVSNRSERDRVSKATIMAVRFLVPRLLACCRFRSKAPDTGLKLFLTVFANFPVRHLLWYILRTEFAS